RFLRVRLFSDNGENSVSSMMAPRADASRDGGAVLVSRAAARLNRACRASGVVRQSAAKMPTGAEGWLLETRGLTKYFGGLVAVEKLAVTLDRLRHALAKELSGGQSMLLQIARGLMVHPIHLFLMDEPFAGVHPTIKDTIMETIVRMNQEERVTFLIVSHEMSTLRRLCPRVTVMHEGHRIAEGTFEE